MDPWEFIQDTAERYVRDPAQEFLGGYTLGMGDEAIAALRAPIRAAQESGATLNPLTWGPVLREAVTAPSNVVMAPFGLAPESTQGAYNRELADIREDQKRFQEANSVPSFLLNLAGGIGSGGAFKQAFPQLSATISQAVRNSPALAGGALAGAQGAATGFLEGEGGLGNRLVRAVDVGIPSAVLSGALGVAGHTLPSESLEEEAQKMARNALGVTKDKINKSINSISGQHDKRQGAVQLVNQVDRMVAEGVMDSSVITNPKATLDRINSLQEVTGKDISDLVKVAKGVEGLPDFDRSVFDKTRDMVESYTGTDADGLVKAYEKEVNSVMSKVMDSGLEGVEAAQDQKQRIYKAVRDYYSKAEKSDAVMKSAAVKMSLASDLREYIEKTTAKAIKEKRDDPSVASLMDYLGKKYKASGADDVVRMVNQKYGDLEAMKPLVDENITKRLSQTFLKDRLIPGMKSTGGFGIPAVIGAIGAGTGQSWGLPLLALAGTGGVVATSPLAQYTIGKGLAPVGQGLELLPRGWTRGIVGSKVAGIKTGEED